MAGPIVSRKTKIKEKRGSGNGADYKPYIKAREIASLGTCSNIVDWKHGRVIETLSEGETWLYYILRWDDSSIDLREQYPLDLDETNRLAEHLNIQPPSKGLDNMTTDILVTKAGGSLAAWSVKDSKESVNKNPRTVEKLYLEKMYWSLHGVKWSLIYKTDLNRVYVDNIRLCVEFFDVNRVFDDISLMKHLIAVKKISLDMKTAPLEFGSLVNKEPYKTLIKEERGKIPWLI